MANPSDDPAELYRQATTPGAKIVALLAKLSEKFEPGDNNMKQWMIENFDNPALIDLLQETTGMMLRVLDAIGHLEPVNGITIAEQFRIPKGTVSKVTRRLIEQNLIQKESLPNNKKEILFRTTPLGRELFLAHRAFDHQMEKGFLRFLEQYNDDELHLLIRVLEDANQASWLEIASAEAPAQK